MSQCVNLVADVGGTNTRLAFSTGNSVRSETIRRYQNNTAESFEEILDQYLSDMAISRVGKACIAVAGPIHGNSAELTNMNWKIQNER